MGGPPTITNRHGKWADMMVEFYSQHKESIKDVDKIVQCLKNPKWKNLDAKTFTSPGFKTSNILEPPYTFIYQLSTPPKWILDQAKLSVCFISNSSPVCLALHTTVLCLNWMMRIKEIPVEIILQQNPNQQQQHSHQQISLW
jgi:hypothetical protein